MHHLLPNHLMVAGDQKRILVTLLFSISCLLPGHSQQKTVRHSGQQWVQYYNQFVFSDPWSLLTDAGYRVQDWTDHKSQFLLRSGLGYLLNSRTRITFGLAHSGTRSSGRLHKKEWRTYQELLLKESFKKVKLSHRFRSEQRWTQELTEDGNFQSGQFSWRFRYRVLCSIPVAKGSGKVPGRQWLLSFGDEIFINAGKAIVHNIFGKNRLLLGTTRQFDPNLTISLTYNRQFSAGNAPNDHRQQHILWLGINQKITAKRKNAATPDGKQESITRQPSRI